MLAPAEHVDRPRRLRRLRRGHRGDHRERDGQDGDLQGAGRACSSDDAILASNTSTISITRMAASAPHPERFVGMHFFHPVDRMELVEVIRGEKTSDETVATIVALAKRIRKTPIVVKRLRRVPGQPRPVPLHERGAAAAAGGGVDGGDRRGGHEVRHADGPDRPARPGRARHGAATPAR